MPNKPLHNTLKSYWWVVVLACVGLITLYTFLCPMRDGPRFTKDNLTIIRADGTRAQFAVDVAHTPEQQAHGMMFRKMVPAMTGMIFVEDEPREVAFWMKNTLVPLDMLFIAVDGRIAKIVAHAKPLDLTPIPSEGVVKAVLEIGGGEAARLNIKEGDRVVFKEFDQ